MIPFQTLLAENAPFLGTFVQSAAPEFLEASAYAGFRFAAIDLEHTYYGVEKMAELIRQTTQLLNTDTGAQLQDREIIM